MTELASAYDMVPRIVKVGRVFCPMFNEKCGAKWAAAKKEGIVTDNVPELGNNIFF